jgi:hypothetical protein
MVFLNLAGDLRSNAGQCGALSQPQASFWLACENRLGGSVPSVEEGPAPVAHMPVGRHSCRAQVETLDHVNGQSQYVAGGGAGTLTLREDGARVTAQYSGDASLAGTLHFTATTSTTAHADAGQSLTAPCMATKGPGGPSRRPELAPIAAGSITIIDSTLFLSFAGTMADSSSCPGRDWRAA